jgi:hypothetical protein
VAAFEMAVAVAVQVPVEGAVPGIAGTGIPRQREFEHQRQTVPADATAEA